MTIPKPILTIKQKCRECKNFGSFDEDICILEFTNHNATPNLPTYNATEPQNQNYINNPYS